ncbi:ABC transporter permease [Clostridium sp. P21]|uniref:ABC transporter permease n=1 Tax=Clostridium muellerianum TaxID=2716538 RepID=A0A7Y0EG58_9CLOT|nr:oligopeptide ABC transporter permease [Clostridium muellerianum]NMM62891.1 ABC transporter permease [Clostridium muellerianum]
MEAKLNTNKIKEEKILSPTRIVWNRLKKNKLAIVGLGILVFMLLFAIVGPYISPYKMDTLDLVNISAAPSIHHWLGTDEVGRDSFARLMYAGRISLAVGFFAVIVEIVLGSILGAIAGFYGGLIDSIIMRIVDIFLCIPFLPILMALGALMSDLKVRPENKMFVVMFIIGALSWPGLCRLVRAQILSLREQEFMQAAEALGLKDSRKILRHLLPNTLASIIVTATLGIGGAILTESTLSFLGLGVTPPTPSWGTLIQSVQNMYVLQYQPWNWIPPGVCILLTVVAINLLGDGLRDAIDPKLKK